MRKRLKGLVICVLIVVLSLSGVVFGKNIQESITAVYKNIKLMVDGVEISPKDVNGNSVEPFIYNGTTYLPIRSIAEALNKEVYFDNESATIYINDSDNHSKQLYSNYTKGTSNIAKNNTYIYEPDIIVNALFFNMDEYDYMQADVYEISNSVTYSLNGTGKKVKGTFVAPTYNSLDNVDYVISFYNEKNELLYQSPTMTRLTPPTYFEFNPGDAQKLKIEHKGFSNGNYASLNSKIKDFEIITSDK